MKVFISWSGKRSRLVAELLHNWIQCVIQAVEPWVSSHDIDRGAVWFSQISNELGASTQGVICLTHKNKDMPWILFEAGALAKGLTSSKVYTFLIDLKPEDIKDPLAQFNHTLPTKDDLYKLVLSINRELDSKPVADGILRQVFDANWSSFEDKFKNILSETENDNPPIVQRAPDDMLSEILNAVRGIDRRVRFIEDKSQNDALAYLPASAVDLRKKPYYSVLRELARSGISDVELIASIKNILPGIPDDALNIIISQVKSDLYRNVRQPTSSSEQ